MGFRDWASSFKSSGRHTDRVAGPKNRSQHFGGALDQATKEAHQPLRGHTTPTQGHGVPWVHPALSQMSEKISSGGAQSSHVTIGHGAKQSTVRTVLTASNQPGRHAGGENSTSASWESGTRGKTYKGKRGTGYSAAKTQGYTGKHRAE